MFNSPRPQDKLTYFWGPKHDQNFAAFTYNRVRARTENVAAEKLNCGEDDECGWAALQLVV
jgi:hypothetical protein